MKKKHILLIENGQDEVEFFTDALQKSKLDFLCSTARSREQAMRILKNAVPDIIFFDVRVAVKEDMEFLNEVKGHQKIPVVMYSTTDEVHERGHINYLRLPQSVPTMAKLLIHLLD